MNPAELHVITVYSNPCRYAARARLHRANQARQAAAGVTSWVVEATFGERPPEVADPDNPRHVVVRCDHEVWLKEAMLNVGLEAVPADAKYVMWQDGDIEFVRSDWAMETIQALQHYRVVQPWTHAIDLGPDLEVIETHSGFAFEWEKGNRPGRRYPTFMHPGYCWAWRRKPLDQVGGFLDRAVCGAADHHMALGLIGLAEWSLPGNVSASYRAMVMDWQARATKFVAGDVGHVPGAILHHFHGWKPERNYVGRWQIITENGFDPGRDLVKDSQGMLRLTGGKPKLRDDLRRYFRSRMEDAGRKTWPVSV